MQFTIIFTSLLKSKQRLCYLRFKKKFFLFVVFCGAFLHGGAMRDRTADLLRAKQALSQLSYSPLTCLFCVMLRCTLRSSVMYFMYTSSSLIARLA